MTENNRLWGKWHYSAAIYKRLNLHSVLYERLSGPHMNKTFRNENKAIVKHVCTAGKKAYYLIKTEMNVYITTSIMQNPSLEADSTQAGHEIPRLL
jgi:hypothetical protein